MLTHSLGNMATLNRWRRLGVLFVGLAISSSTLLAAAEWFDKQPGIFVYRMLSPGTTIDVLKDEVTLPGGKVVALNQSLNGREPWKIDWNKEPDAAPVLVLNWTRVLKLGLLLPITIWAFLEAIAFASGWIMKGVRLKAGKTSVRDADA